MTSSTPHWSSPSDFPTFDFQTLRPYDLRPSDHITPFNFLLLIPLPSRTDKQNDKPQQEKRNTDDGKIK